MEDGQVMRGLKGIFPEVRENAWEWCRHCSLLLNVPRLPRVEVHQFSDTDSRLLGESELTDSDSPF